MSPIKRLLIAFLLAAATAQPASAQAFGDDRAATNAMAFLRIPFGSTGLSSQAQDMRFGLALNTGCRSSLALSGAGLDACSNAPLRSMELGGGPRSDWTLSFSGAGRRADIASFSPRTGMLRLAGGGAGNADWLWIGLAAAGGVALTAKMIDDGDFVFCSGEGANLGNDRSCEID